MYPPPPPPSSLSPQRAELNGRSVMNSSAGEARAAKILSNVMDARRRLEEDAEVAVAAAVTVVPGEGGEDMGQEGGAAAVVVDDAAGAGLRGRLEEAMAVAEVRARYFERKVAVVCGGPFARSRRGQHFFVSPVQRFCKCFCVSNRRTGGVWRTYWNPV